MKKQELKQINFDIMIGNLRIDLFMVRPLSWLLVGGCVRK